ncbi:MAG: DNA-directed RNA polymerase subunit beta, partial [Oscillospiraceae bacterium]|nr:DNA-directed RNA polymerase subunit beta [Oscillospiraceae bacterium]
MVNVHPVKLGKNERMSFSHIDEVLDMPNLIEVQKNSYRWFLTDGLKEVFRDVSTIEDYTGNLVLDFIDYRLEETPKYSVEECKERDATYNAPLKVRARLLNKETGEIKEQDIFMGDFPLMTDSGTFVINGAERVIISQLVRSPGVYFSMTRDKSGKKLYETDVIPNRGAWLEYETNANDIFFVRIDKNHKMPVTVFLRALGLGSNSEIIDLFGENELLLTTLEKDSTTNVEEGLLETYRKLRPGELPTVDGARSHLNNLFFDPRRYDLSRFGRYKYNKKLSLVPRIYGHELAQDVIDERTGELLASAGEKISRELGDKIARSGVSRVEIYIEDLETKEKSLVRLLSNGMVDIDGFVDFDAK